MDAQWAMVEVQSPSGLIPNLRDAEVPAALLAVHRGEAMGLTAGNAGRDVNVRLGALLEAARREQVGALAVGQLWSELETPERDSRKVIAHLKRLYDALGENPAPRQECQALLEYLEEEELAALLQVSKSSVQRYCRGERHAPAPVVDRLHWLALVVGSLTGTYNAFGVGRWFERPRVVLDGKSPKEMLLADGGWTPEVAAAKRVEKLANETLGMVVT